ncbi:hypothetical protein LIA77_05931 [Sarocladium implicatum]|nr:hypothetical protein LIA77_05931 [Sarocladium implicatum]
MGEGSTQISATVAGRSQQWKPSAKGGSDCGSAYCGCYYAPKETKVLPRLRSIEGGFTRTARRPWDCVGGTLGCPDFEARHFVLTQVNEASFPSIQPCPRIDS